MAKPALVREAAFQGDPVKMAEALQGRGAKHAASQADSRGRSVLVAAMAGQSGDDKASQCARLLMAAGADPNQADTQGQTALQWAARLGRPLCCQALIEAGARVDAAANEKFRAIEMALLSADEQTVWILIGAGADVASPPGPEKPTPLQRARELLLQAQEKVKAGGPSALKTRENRQRALDALELHFSAGPASASKRSLSL